MTTYEDLEALLIDARYAARQCREFRDPDRAADALGRIEERLGRLLAEADLAEAQDFADERPSARDLEELYAQEDAYRRDTDDDIPF